jgi:hypothetical protein
MTAHVGSRPAMPSQNSHGSCSGSSIIGNYIYCPEEIEGQFKGSFGSLADPANPTSSMAAFGGEAVMI